MAQAPPVAPPSAEHPQEASNTPPETAPDAPPPDLLASARWLILVGLCLASIMEVLDTTIINVALPQMAGNLNCTTDEIAWVSTSYILANVVVLPMTAWLSARFGARRYLLFSITTFLVASILCGTSRSLGEIVLWRLLQGAAGAPLISITQATILRVFPRKQHAMVQGIWGLGIVAAPTAAPALGGWIVDNYSWPWIFFVNVPIAFAAAGLLGVFLPSPKPAPGDAPDAAGNAGVDWAGIGLLAVGLGGVQYVLEEGNRKDWFSDPLIVWFAVVGVSACLLFVVWELWPTNRSPVVDLRVLKDRGLFAGTLLSLILGFGLYAGLYLFTIFAQGSLGFTATKTGIVLLPGGASIGFGMIFCGIVLGKGVQPRTLIIFGMLVFVYSQWLMGHFSPQSGEWDTGVGLLVRGFGLGFLFIPITAAALASLKSHDIPQGSALTSLARQLGGSFGIAISSTYVTHLIALHRTNLVARVYEGNPLYNERISGLTAHFIGGGYAPDTARAAAQRLMDGVINGQAYVMAVNDAYLMIGIVFAVAFPLVFLLKKAEGPVNTAGAH